MLGALFGDLAGSAYEIRNTHDYDFDMITRFSMHTDDSYMTLAVADALMETYGQSDEIIRQKLVEKMQQMGRKYPNGGYGGMFALWLEEDNPHPYGSFGNGSAMRVSPAGWLYTTMDETMHAAVLSAEVTHNHPEGIKGAKAIAACIYLARMKASKEDILHYVTNVFGYDMNFTLDAIRDSYHFDETCQGSVPQAIRAFYEGKDYEDVIRLAVSLGGDSDTIACMAGGIAEAYYGMPEMFRKKELDHLDAHCRKIVHNFQAFYHVHSGTPKDDLMFLFSQAGPDAAVSENLEETILYTGGDLCSPRLQQALSDQIVYDARLQMPVIRKEGMALTEGFSAVSMSSPEGKGALAVFTSTAAAAAAHIQHTDLIGWYPDSVMEMILENDAVSGLWINGQEGVFLDKKELKKLLEEAYQRREAMMQPDEKIAYHAAKPHPALVSSIHQLIENSHLPVEKVYYSKGEDGSLWLQIFCAEEQAENVKGQLRTFLHICYGPRLVFHITANTAVRGEDTVLIYPKEEAHAV